MREKGEEGLGTIKELKLPSVGQCQYDQASGFAVWQFSQELAQRLGETTCSSWGYLKEIALRSLTKTLVSCTRQKFTVVSPFCQCSNKGSSGVGWKRIDPSGASMYITVILGTLLRCYQPCQNFAQVSSCKDWVGLSFQSSAVLSVRSVSRHLPTFTGKILKS